MIILETPYYFLRVGVGGSYFIGEHTHTLTHTHTYTHTRARTAQSYAAAARAIIGVCKNTLLLFTGAFPLQSSSRTCSPTPHVCLKLIYPRVLFSGGVVFHRHWYEATATVRFLRGVFDQGLPCGKAELRCFVGFRYLSLSKTTTTTTTTMNNSNTNYNTTDKEYK